MKQQFFLVMGAGKPHYHHDSYESAEAEARRLAAAHPTQEFLILAAVASVRQNNIVVEKFDEIPF